MLKGSLESLGILHRIVSQHGVRGSHQQLLPVLSCDLRSVRWNYIKADMNRDIHYGSAWFVTNTHIPHPLGETSKVDDAGCNCTKVYITASSSHPPGICHLWGNHEKNMLQWLILTTLSLILINLTFDPLHLCSFWISTKRILKAKNRLEITIDLSKNISVSFKLKIKDINGTDIYYLLDFVVWIFMQCKKNWF